jgi:putative zinc finger/helix-turn-helix YgiT family protein
MKNLYALKCQCGENESSVRVKKETMPVRGENIEIESNIRVCNNCGEELFDEKLEEDNLSRAYEEYRKKKDIIRADEIRQIREKYGLSQRTLGKILGWGEITIHRYESGAIPDLSHHKILRLLEDPNIVKTLVADVKALIPRATYKRIMGKIDTIIYQQEDGEFVQMFEGRFKHSEIGLDSGYKQFDLAKFCNVALFYAHNVKNLWITKINKLLFYTDFSFFKEFTVSLTGTKYIKLDHGPVPNDYEILYWGLEDAGYIRRIPEISGQFSGYIIEPMAEFDRDIFTQEELETMEKVLIKYGEVSSNYVRSKSHEEKGWINTDMLQVIPYSYASDLIN